ncbi:uncharacterized protein EV154DRAFT_515243 [Mucor mucedo]|uniref:uncharacterized protein n=1 Tax=Mucor mucedo TaxID=29922 RepID=UPI0022202D23|nr:uncharacterized protein EV154DRAFT_515243 [Mucor mucedo]KAI7889184.1 hypothetical protein EV154DRAFT_515243 [Mucor mucedo]
MSNREGSSKGQKPSAISKQVLKSNPIPQSVHNTNAATVDNNHNAVRGKPTQPLRSTKVSQKLVLFPQSSADDADTTMKSTLPIDAHPSSSSDTTMGMEYLEEEQPLRTSMDDHQHQQWQDEQRQPRTAGVPLPIEWTFGSRTPAERMTKDERELALLPRAAAYCTGEGYDLTRLRPFLRQHHRVAPRLYDECLYAAYHFPLRTLRPDKDNLYNIKVRSNVPKAPHRHNTNDEEEMDYDEDHFNMTAEAPTIVQPRPGQPFPEYYMKEEQEDEVRQQQEQEQRLLDEFQKQQEEVPEGIFDNPFSQENDIPISSPPLLSPTVEQEEKELKPVREPFKGGEVFIFDYGVVVFWNFRRAEELLMLEDFMQFSIEPFRDNPDEDMQIEEIHFQYDTSQMKPRIFNDMITLKSSNHMIKLTLSHGLSQSAVVARYEDIMDKTIEDTKHLPKEMAETGRLGKTRSEITKINGQLFTLRMNVNLVSNVLDTPEIFWSEPALQPMYTAIREYLEIPQRAKILNDRLRVISDLLSMLRDHLTNFGVEYQTLIIIYLIIVAVIVACFEIAVKILQSIKVI